MARLVWICLAGAAGTGTRYLLGLWSVARWGTGFPWGTLLVNVVGSFLVAVIAQVGLRAPWMSPTLRLALTTGFMGGFTTYSAFNYETLRFLQDGAGRTALVYFGATLLLCLGAGFGGIATGRALSP